MSIHFRVIATPKPQARPRATVVAGRAKVYNAANGFRDLVYLEASKHAPPKPFTRATELEVLVNFARPKDHFNSRGVLKESAPARCAQHADWDNLGKTICDALVNAGVLADDRIIDDARVVKAWCGNGELPGCEITLTEDAT